MHATHLNEHDANQGAQSTGEFLGMSGNSSWYLLGSAGGTVLMVVFLWGIFGISPIVCLLIGLALCGLSVAYVFLLKNNRPLHYDTDFFEAALIEAGVLGLAFGPRERRVANPFTGAWSETSTPSALTSPAARKSSAVRSSPVRRGKSERPVDSEIVEPVSKAASSKPVEAVVKRADYERVQEQLRHAEEALEESLADTVEE